MKRFFYAEIPEIVEQVGEMSFYRWDIKQEENGYSCYQVSFPGAIVREKVTEAVMEAMFGNGYEQKLLNDFNAATSGLLAEEYKQPYLNFLIERKNLKSEIHEAIQ